MFQSMNSLINGVRSNRERITIRLREDLKAFESMISIGSLVDKYNPPVRYNGDSVIIELTENPDYKPEVAKMYRRLTSRLAYSERLLITMRRTHAIG